MAVTGLTSANVPVAARRKPRKSLQDRVLGRMFKKVDNVVWDLMSGGTGFISADGDIITLSGEGDDADINLNPWSEMAIEIPAFATAKDIASLANGDVIVTDRGPIGFIVSLPAEGKKTFKLLKPDGSRTTWQPPKTNNMMMAGNTGPLVLQSLINTTGGTEGLKGLQDTLMPMLMLSNGNMGGIEKMLPFLLMSGGSGMLGGGGFMNMMLMSKMMDGGGGMADMFSGLFGSDDSGDGKGKSFFGN